MTNNDDMKPISVRGADSKGVVVSDKNKKTVIVQKDLVTYVPKFKRYARKISRITAHNPDDIGAQTGDVVKIAECRKISKTKAWVVTKIITKGKGYIQPGQVKSHDEQQRSDEEMESAKVKPEPKKTDTADKTTVDNNGEQL